MKKILKLAEEIAREAHKGQYRRDGKTSYIVHIERIVKQVNIYAFKNGWGHTENAVVVAWLHDVVEDTNITIANLLEKGIPFNLVVAIEALTRRPKENYLDYILKVKRNDIAKEIKLWDIDDNLNDNPTPSQKQKYVLAKYILNVT